MTIMVKIRPFYYLQISYIYIYIYENDMVIYILHKFRYTPCTCIFCICSFCQWKNENKVCYFSLLYIFS